MKKFSKCLFIIVVISLFIVPVYADENLKVELVEEVGCNSIEPIMDFIQLILNYIRAFGITMAVIMQVIDYIKAVYSSKDDDIVKANGHFSTRIIVVSLLFLVPSLIICIMDLCNVPGTDSGTCGIY